MVLYFVITAVVAVVGIFALFDIRFSDISKLLQASKPRYTLKDRTMILQGKTPDGIRKKSRYEIEQILDATGRRNVYDRIEQASFLAAAGGLIVAILVDNWFLAVPFVIAGYLAPRWYIKATVASHKRQLNEELETALSIITTSYLRSEDITKAVRENLHYINEPMRSHFATFLSETQYVNANVTAALNNLKSKVPNNIFAEWCNALIMCQTNRDMKDVLQGIVQKFSSVRVVQANLDTIISEPRFEAFCMMGLVVGSIPLMKWLNEDWYQSLMFTEPGKITIAIVACLIVFAISRIMNLSRPIEYEM